jgi:uncharacterized protein (DUF2141 family)
MMQASALLVLALMLAQQPARDQSNRALAPAGTASMAGTVISDDGTAQPVRRARVSLVSTDGAVTRNDLTDDRGTFAFRDLPAGRYSLSAWKSTWLTTSYGAARPQRPGTPIAVADGARMTGVVVRMTRGAVITGVIRDANGQPAQGITLQLSLLTMRNGERAFNGVEPGLPAPLETDDTGTYRIYGLPPGNFIIAAVPRKLEDRRGDGGSFLRMTSDDIARANELLRQGKGDLPAPPAPVKLAPVFYPGTTDPLGATVLSLTAGEERNGIDITMQIVPTLSLEGIVTDSTGAPQFRASVLAVSGGMQLGNLMGLNGVTQAMTDDSGRYRLTGLAPGEYSLLSSADKLWAEVAVSVSGQDLNVPLTLQPYPMVTGHVVFDGAATPPNPFNFRYSLSASGSVASLMARTAAGTVVDGEFTGPVVPGRYQLQFSGIPAGWYPKSAIARGQDAFDAPVTVGPNDRLMEFVVTFTDKPTELTGSLVDSTGRPASEYFVVVFSTDRRFWTQPSRRVLQIRPGSDGAFSVKGLPAGDYFVSALTDIEPGEPLTAEFLDAVLAASPAVQITMRDGQRTVQPLKIGG